MRKINAAWLIALGVMMMLMTAQAHAAAQRKPAKAPAVKSQSTAQKGESVSWTGCLHADHNHYFLKDAQGQQVPKSRSWKRGFLKKTSKDVRVVGASNSVNLKDHAGHQVTIVGVRNGDSQIRARSIRHMATSCL